MISKIWKHSLAVTGLIALVILSYYLNMPVDVKSVLFYLKARPLLNI
jgi:hypothetical protein